MIRIKVTDDTQMVKLAKEHGITPERMACCAVLVGLEVIEANPDQFGELVGKFTAEAEQKVRPE